MKTNPWPRRGVETSRWGDPIVLPTNSREPGYEAELAFVIGKGGVRIQVGDWREHVYGYTIVHEISARDIQRFTSQRSIFPKSGYFIESLTDTSPHVSRQTSTLPGSAHCRKRPNL